jgi:chromosome segregation ATPase
LQDGALNSLKDRLESEIAAREDGARSWEAKLMQRNEEMASLRAADESAKALRAELKAVKVHYDVKLPFVCMALSSAFFVSRRNNSS